MNVILKKGNASDGASKLNPGEWGKDEKGRVFVRCQHEDHIDKRPRIGLINLGMPDVKYWDIDSNGNVTPSIYFKEPNCDWHVFAKLEDWKP